MKIIGYIATTIILMGYSAVMNGWALVKLWSWFIVPVFSAPVLTMISAIGLSLVVQYFTVTSPSNKKTETTYGETLLLGFLWSTIKPLFALAFGALIKAMA